MRFTVIANPPRHEFGNHPLLYLVMESADSPGHSSLTLIPPVLNAELPACLQLSL